LLRRRNDFSDRYNGFLQALRDGIVSGELKPGEYILPENTLSEIYDLSRVSVRKALAQLVDEGLVEKIAGKGNRVRMPDGKQTVTTLRLAWYSNSYEMDIVKRIIREFERKHPLIKVELFILPAVGYTESLIERIEEEEGPDVFIIGDMHLQTWIEAGKTDQLEAYVPSHLNPETTSYPQVFALFAHEGVHMGAPFLFSPVVICYNRELFLENGVPENAMLTDWNDLLHIAKQCTRDLNGDGIVDQYGFSFSSSYHRWPLFLLQNGGRIMSEDNSRLVLSAKENVEALEYCLSLMYKHQVSPIYSLGSSSLAESLFAKQRVAMILTTYFFMNEFRDRSHKWDVLPMPGNRRKATFLLGGALALNAKSGSKKMAKKLIDFMTGEAAQKILKTHGCTIPALKAVAEDDTLLDPAIHPRHYNRFLEELPYAVSPRELGLRSDLVDELSDELNLLWAGMETPEIACARIEEKINDRLA